MRFIPFNRMTDDEQREHLRAVHGFPFRYRLRETRGLTHEQLTADTPPLYEHTHDKPSLRRDAARLRRSLASWARTGPPTGTNLPISMLASLAADLLEGEDLTDWPAARGFVEWVEGEMRDYR